MGANRKLPTPEAYPSAFLSAVRNGGGVIYAEDMPWQPISAAKRFRLCLAVIRERPLHPLYKMACQRWSVVPTGRALTISLSEQADKTPSMAAALIEKALSTRENP